MTKSHLILLTAAAIWLPLLANGLNTGSDENCNATILPLSPATVDTKYSSPELADFFRVPYAAKSADNGTGWATGLNPKQAAYYDSTLGLTVGRNISQITASFNSFTAQFGKDGRSYPLRILGDKATGVVLYFLNTPDLFGAEIRIMSSVDFLDGLITRQIDNWDGRNNKVKSALKGDPTYPYPFGQSKILELAAPQMENVSHSLNAALEARNASAASALFSMNGKWEDLTLRTRLEGQVQIQAYLDRALKSTYSLPYAGPDTQVFHVLGNANGGGYEWRPNQAKSSVQFGISAIELDDCGKIIRFTSVWDGSRVNSTVIEELAGLGVDLM